MSDDKIIDGNAFSKHLIQEVKQKTDAHVQSGLRRPKLCVILVGDDKASKIYVSKKQQKSREAGIDSDIINYTSDISEDKLLDAVPSLNEDDGVDGILVQLPLPGHIDANKVLETISARC